MTIKPTGATRAEDNDTEVGLFDLDEAEAREARDEAARDDDEFALIDRLRERLDIGDELSDVTIAASLTAVAATGDMRGRWLAAFGSPLGRYLAMRGADLNTALNTVLALAPRRH